MLSKFVPILWQFLLVAAAIHIAATQVSADVDYKIEQLNEDSNEVVIKLVLRSGVVTNRIPSSCVEALRGHNESGVYQIYLPENGLTLVYCMADPNNGLPWTVVQRRVDGSTDFFRKWDEYKNGFGNLNNNFFIGLEKLHLLTNGTEPQELWVNLIDNVTVSAYYDRFAIGNEVDQYALNILGNFRGDAGDSLSYHRGMKFTTKDVDNDLESSNANCAYKARGAWWYKNCQESNLNGVYGSTVEMQGINWRWFRGHYVSMKYAHMAIRPVRK